MKRSLTTKNLYDKKPGAILELQNPVLRAAFGPIERKGIVLIYGPEKNGKTWFGLTFARDIATTERVLYVSGEEGTDLSFQEACRRAGITTADNILWEEYMPIEELEEKLQKRGQPKVVFIDNLTIYKDELSGLALKQLSERNPSILFIPFGHYERKEPYPAAAKMAKIMSKAYVEIIGLKAFVVSRYAPQGGEIIINDDLSEMYWGVEQVTNNE